MIYNSYDRANYLEMKEGKINLISFSCAIMNIDLLDLPCYSISKSSSIIIFMQVIAKKELCMPIFILKSYYESRMKLKKEVLLKGTSIDIFNIYYSKILHNLI